MKLQKTIQDEARIVGKGLFGGQDSKVLFRPGPENSGVVFVRTDVAEPVRISAITSNIAERSRRTALKNGSVSIETVEHCLAAVSALEIDNLIIEVAGSELPGSDCSSAGFFKALKGAGIVEQSAVRKEYVIGEPITITEGEASIYALPYADDCLNITYDLDYGGHTGIGRQVFSCRLTPDGFEKNLASARTFKSIFRNKSF